MDSISAVQILMITLGWGLGAFLIYFFYLSYTGIQAWFVSTFGLDSGKLYHAISAKLLGFFTMGIATLWYAVQLFAFLVDSYMGFQWPVTGWLENGLLAFLAIALFYGIYRKRQDKSFLETYPETDLSVWNAPRMWSYLSAWTLYLIGYEILFRGLLLIALIPFLGMWWALFVHVLVYALAHLHKNRLELLGSIVFGMLIGLFCAYTRSIFPALVLHLIVSLSTNYFAIRKGGKFQ